MGMLFLVAIVVYATGNVLIDRVCIGDDFLAQLPAHRIAISVGALLLLLNTLAVVGIGVLSRPFLKPAYPFTADLYFALRIVEGLLLALGIVALLALIPLSEQYAQAEDGLRRPLQGLAHLLRRFNFYAYQLGMVVLGVGGTAFCSVLYRHVLVPRWLACLGMAGYLGLLAGAVAEVVGYPIGLMLAGPGGVFELVFGIWLIVQGLPVARVRGTDASGESPLT